MERTMKMSTADYASVAVTAGGAGRATARRVARRTGLRLGGTAAVAAIAAAAALSLAGPAGASVQGRNISSHYSFRTLDNKKDLTFNQLLGIDNAGVISGYFGSGLTASHPNRGYVLSPNYHQSDYVSENFPHSTQTQVTGLNNVGNTVGFWVNKAGANFGFYTAGTHFHQVDFPKATNASPQVDQLLGINDHGVAVGFYTNSSGNNRGYEYNIHTRKYSRVLEPGASQGLSGPSLTATAINNHGTIAGFFTTGTGVVAAFVKTAHTFTQLNFPGASMTQAFGINDSGEVVGSYTTGTSKTPPMHGFIWTHANGFKTVNDPQGVNTTIINGLNKKGYLVGFYVGKGGNTNGFLAKPRG
jgi:hypothetical protein